MNRRGISLAVIFAVLASSQPAAAQFAGDANPAHYEFLPRFSTLTERISNTDLGADIRINGAFDLFTYPGPTDVWPPQYLSKFENVKAGGPHPIRAEVLSLDNTLGLSNLVGRHLRTPGPVELIHFTGETNTHAQVSLYGAEFGNFLYLRGSTQPPAANTRYVYSLRALARQRPSADFDNNDTVDDVDFARWAPRFGLNPSVGASATMGDADGDLDVDGVDFLVWQRQIGEVAPSLASLDGMMDAAIAAAVTVSAVPEPSGTTFVLTAGAALLGIRRRVRNS